MDNYSIQATLGGGAQAGAVLKVTHKKLKRSFVMKQVLCKTEKAAERALKEAKSLENLSHEFVCGYWEYFSFWSEEKKCIIFCIVMDYYLLGDLLKILTARRREGKPIEEQLIVKWMSQMVSVLAYIHGKKIIHRDLKPGNIFIKNESLDLVVGDFGIVAEMGEDAVATRTVIGSLIWMAPEVTGRQYDERSDLWSLGCILVALMTCHIWREEDFSQNMIVMKKDKQAIAITMSLLEKTYSKDLVSVVRSLLKQDFKERPYSESLSELPIIKEYFERSKTCKELPTTKDIPGALAFLKQHPSNAVQVTEALRLLSTAPDLNASNEDERSILDAIQSNKALTEICALGMRVCARLSEKMREDDLLLTEGAAKILTSAAQRHPDDFTVQLSFLTFCRISASIKTEQLCGIEDLVPSLLRCLDVFRDRPEAGIEACQALNFLCNDDESILERLSELGAFRKAHDFLIAHLDDSSCVAASFALLVPFNDADIAEAEELNLVHLALTSIKGFLEHEELLKIALFVLENLATEEQMARSFVECQSAEGRTTLEGITILSDVFKAHKNKAEIVAKVLLVLRTALEHDDVAGICNVSLVKSLAEEASQLHSKDKTIKECYDKLKKI